MCFEIDAYSVWSEFWIRRRDVVFRCIGDSLPTSNYKADWHLQASTGRLFTCQLPFFFSIIHLWRSSQQRQRAHWKSQTQTQLCNASLLNRRSRNKNICKKSNHCHMNLEINKSVSLNSSAFNGSCLKLCFNNNFLLEICVK